MEPKRTQKDPKDTCARVKLNRARIVHNNVNKQISDDLFGFKTIYVLKMINNLDLFIELFFKHFFSNYFPYHKITEWNYRYSADSFGDKCKHDLEIIISFGIIEKIAFEVKPIRVIFKSLTAYAFIGSKHLLIELISLIGQKYEFMLSGIGEIIWNLKCTYKQWLSVA